MTLPSFPTAVARLGVAIFITFGGSLLLDSTMSGSALATPAYISGHGDIGVAFHVDENELELHYHLEGSGTNLPTDPLLYEGGVISLGTYIGYEVDHPGAWGSDEILTLVPEDAKRSNPSVNIQNALGISGTDSFWRLPQSFAAEVPFLGLATDDLAEDSGTWSDITFSLMGLSGPGNFALWEVDGEEIFHLYWQSVGGIGPADMVTLTSNQHSHFAWGFSQPGTYELTIQASGSRTVSGGSPVLYESDPTTFTFQVVPEPGSLMLAGIGCLGTVGASWMRRRNSRTRRQ